MMFIWMFVGILCAFCISYQQEEKYNKYSGSEIRAGEYGFGFYIVSLLVGFFMIPFAIYMIISCDETTLGNLK